MPLKNEQKEKEINKIASERKKKKLEYGGNVIPERNKWNFN